MTTRPLRDVFTDLTGDEQARRDHAADPQGYLSAQGHPDLPADLVAEAVVSFADAAPPPVAEHLAPFVMGHSSVPYGEEIGPAPEPDGWLDLLAGAPPVDAYEEPPPDDTGAWPGGPDDPSPAPFGAGGDLDFGRGAAAGAGLTAVIFGADADDIGGIPAPEHHADLAVGPDPAGLDDLVDHDGAGHPFAIDPHHHLLDHSGLDDGSLDDSDDDLPDA